jgi:hypothetical protein
MHLSSFNPVRAFDRAYRLKSALRSIHHFLTVTFTVTSLCNWRSSEFLVMQTLQKMFPSYPQFSLVFPIHPSRLLAVHTFASSKMTPSATYLLVEVKMQYWTTVIYGPPTGDFYAPESILNILRWEVITASKILFRLLESIWQKLKKRLWPLWWWLYDKIDLQGSWQTVYNNAITFCF